ncbi:MAG: sugar kinase [Acidobacteria bacterium]|nr:MAG: sugar kinase [Acidobacteriota bacterium]
MPLDVPAKDGRRWDLVALGEVMLRFDPGETRMHTARTFQVWEGGGEYNVARGLKRCFGLDTALVSALADNPVGRLVQDLIFQGGVDQSHVVWRKYDGVGRECRNGLNFVERGFGIRAGVGCSDRGHTAVSQLGPGDVDWAGIFDREGAHWLHTGGIFCALSDTTPEVAREAMEAARRHGASVSFDLNYRESLWRAFGGHARAIVVNRSLVPLVDVLIGNEEDFSAALGFQVTGVSSQYADLDLDRFKGMIRQVVREFPHLRVVATTLRHAKSATVNDWSAICWAGGDLFDATPRPNLEILDRIGGGDSFASGLIYGLMTGRGPQWAVECGAAHGALAMTTPGDTSMATLADVERVMQGGTARVLR